MKTIHVQASRAYPVHIGSGTLALLPQALRSQRVCIISDETVWSLYGEALSIHLEASGIDCVHFLIFPGESSKSFENFQNILNFLADNRFHRNDCLLALGGGVVGDLTGFCAACYLRGIDYIQAPTTVLAAVDSSVGGKTAIDLPAGKNLAGAFWQPASVICDTDVLSSLPRAVFRQGCSEVIKYGILYDELLFSQLENQGLSFDREAVIARCVELKASAVQADELDLGARRMLNLGHTFGHAIEKESCYHLSHGEAVSIGMAIAARAAAHLGYCERDTCRRIINLLLQFELPVSTGFSPESLYRHALGDKKANGSTVSIIVPQAIGRCEIVSMDASQLLDFIKAGL